MTHRAIRNPAWVASVALALIAGGCAKEPVYTGTVTDIGPQNARYISVEVQDSSQIIGVYSCDRSDDPICPLLNVGDEISYTDGGNVGTMDEVQRLHKAEG